MADIIFTDGTLWAHNKLGLVNKCMAAINETPFPEGTLLSSLQPGTDGALATTIVEETMIEVQNRGWYFNTDYSYKLLPDTNDFIALPPNTLRIDVGRTSNIGKYIFKNGKVYDRVKQSFKLDDIDHIFVDIIWLTDYEILPPAAYNYIGLRSARKFQQRTIGSQELHSFTQIDEAEALADMQREHMQYQDYNLRSRAVSDRRVNPSWWNS